MALKHYFHYRQNFVTSGSGIAGCNCSYISYVVAYVSFNPFSCVINRNDPDLFRDFLRLYFTIKLPSSAGG